MVRENSSSMLPGISLPDSKFRRRRLTGWKVDSDYRWSLGCNWYSPSPSWTIHSQFPWPSYYFSTFSVTYSLVWPKPSLQWDLSLWCLCSFWDRVVAHVHSQLQWVSEELRGSNVFSGSIHIPFCPPLNESNPTILCSLRSILHNCNDNSCSSWLLPGHKMSKIFWKQSLFVVYWDPSHVSWQEWLFLWWLKLR